MDLAAAEAGVYLPNTKRGMLGCESGTAKDTAAGQGPVDELQNRTCGSYTWRGRVCAGVRTVYRVLLLSSCVVCTALYSLAFG